MYARSSTIVAQPSSIDRGIAFMSDELMSDMLAIDGCVGLSLLADRDTGRCIATSSWDSAEAMQASRTRVPPLRKRLMGAFGATDITNEEWEVVVMHRDHRAPEGAHARISYLHGDPARADDSVEIFKSLLPTIESYGGFCSASLLLNRSTGVAVPNIIFDSAAAMARSAEQAGRVRAGAAERMGSEIAEVAEFELAFAHLRVPELV